jgi:hypothetical protein
MTTYYLGDLIEAAVETEKHFHTKERWRGKLAVQTATNWAADTVSTPFVLTSGNNAFGTAVQILGTGDTPISAGTVKYDLHRIEVADLNNAATPYKIRFAWGATSYADAVTAGDYTDVMFTSSVTNANQFGSAPLDIKMRTVAAGTKMWGAVWHATTNATISFYVGIHEYPTITPSAEFSAGVALPVDLDGIATATDLAPLATGAQVAAVGATVTPKSTSVEVAAVGAAVAEVAETAAECESNAGRRFNV